MLARSWMRMGATVTVAAAGLGQGEASVVKLQWSGPSAVSLFGWAVDAGHDVDGDGVNDFLVGAFRATPAAVYVYSGTGALIRTLTSPPSAGDFGRAVAFVDDLTGDGVSDIVVGASPSGIQDSIHVFSGADGALVRSTPSPLPGTYFGYRVAAAGDVDNDGTPDYVTSAIGPLANPTPYAVVYSGATGAALWTVPGPTGGTVMGVAGAGDVDGDSFDDFLVCELGSSTTAGVARLYSGATGGVLRTLLPPPASMLPFGSDANDGFGFSVRGGEDLDGDGVPDVLVGAFRATYAGFDQAGVVCAYSGASGAVLHVTGGARPSAQFGFDVEFIDDLNADGTVDVVVSAVHDQHPSLAFPGPGSLTFLSGRTGRELFRTFHDFEQDGVCAPATPFHQAGREVRCAGDLDGDGVPEVIVGATQCNLPVCSSASLGEARVVSPSLVGDVETVSVSGGGTQKLFLRAGSSYAGHPYLVLGSLSGTFPDLPLSPCLRIPLRWDAYTTYTASQPNSPVLPTSSGVLGTGSLAGQASTSVVLPPALGALPGMVMRHAFVVLPPSGGSMPVLASNEYPIVFVP